MNYSNIYAKLFDIDEDEKIILDVVGELTDKQRKHFDNRRIIAKRTIRKALQGIHDPLEKSMRNGGKRSCSDNGIGYYEFWYEPDDPQMTDEEVIEYVDSEYRLRARYPGDVFTHVYWNRTKNGLRIITYTSLDV